MKFFLKSDRNGNGYLQKQELTHALTNNEGLRALVGLQPGQKLSERQIMALFSDEQQRSSPGLKTGRISWPVCLVQTTIFRTAA